MSARSSWILVGSAGLLALAVLLRLLVASDGLHWPSDEAVLRLRLDRAVSGIVVGGGVALAGVLLQALLRNPLASPDILGLASGAQLGVMTSIYLGFLAGQGAVPLLGRVGPALAGSLAGLGLVYALSRRRGVVDPLAMILVGVIVAILAGAGSQMLQHLMPDRGFEASRWLLGSLPDDLSPTLLGMSGAVVAASLAIGIVLGPQMDAASLSDDEALSVGVNIKRLRPTLFVLSGVLAAATVVIAGPIGFVGLVCPHVMRLLAGPSHRPLVIGSTLLGGALVVFADVLVRAIPTPTGRLPLGVLTTLIGGPVFVVLLRREMSGEARA